ncbi:hypothetical protein KW799_02700, partial [Candidatus Parcubacteria bacterium]|nr:hypothetical protein [Candidatus Parcubacteria bacterium]
EEENRRLKNELIEQDCYGTFIRALAQLHFSTDDNSRRNAGKGVLVDEDAAHAHWRQNGGPEAFGKAFPTPRSVMHHFAERHSVRRRMSNLAS